MTWVRCLFFFLSLTALYGTPRPKLSETGYLSQTKRPYSPQYALWSDGAAKTRWIFLPAGQKISTEDEDNWNFPVGTKIWKEFTFSKRVETRLMEKVSEEEWEFSTYLWNEEGTEALLAPEDGVKDYYPITSEIKHDIPSVTECQRCHRKGGDPVLGFDAIGLSADRDPHALHAEVLKPEMLTLKKIIEENLVNTVSENFKAGAPSIPGSGRPLFGYLHVNCATCHNPRGSSKHINLHLNHVLSVKAEKDLPAFRTTVGKLAQVASFPGVPESYRILAGKPEESLMWYLMENFGTSHMPPLGAKIKDEKAATLLKKWISSLYGV